MTTEKYAVSFVNEAFDCGPEPKAKSDATSPVTLVKLSSIDEKKAEANKDVSKSEDQQPEREQWDNQCEFILSAVGYAVGLGNVWRFPYLAYENGGGSFLIPYTLMLFFAGLPLFFMELCLGQYSGQGPTRVFGRLAPAFKGLGFAMLLVTFYVSIYYNVIIAWTLFYMFSGMQAILPWSYCRNDTLHMHCHEGNITHDDIVNDPYIGGPSEAYFNSALLGLDKAVHNWSDVGELRWQLVVCLLAAWIIVCLCLIKGVQSAGKVVYFTGM